MSCSDSGPPKSLLGRTNIDRKHAKTWLGVSIINHPKPSYLDFPTLQKGFAFSSQPKRHQSPSPGPPATTTSHLRSVTIRLRASGSETRNTLPIRLSCPTQAGPNPSNALGFVKSTAVYRDPFGRGPFVRNSEEMHRSKTEMQGNDLGRGRLDGQSSHSLVKLLLDEPAHPLSKC